MQGAIHDDGQKIFTLATVAGLIVYFMIALQCLSTFGVAIREMNSTKFAVIQLVALNVLGYGLAVFVVHSLRFLGVA